MTKTKADDRSRTDGFQTEAAQHVTYVEQDELHPSEHNAARDAEWYYINEVGLEKLVNARKGGAGRIPNDTSVGGVLLLVGIVDRVLKHPVQLIPLNPFNTN